MTTFRSAEPDDWPAVEALLTRAELPLAGAREHITGFLLAWEADTLAGCAALEPHGEAALLRSVAVTPERRGTGLGRELVARAIEAARREGVGSLVLLTTTAAGFFPRFGFRVIRREAAPPSLRVSQEFTSACPASAVCMRLELGGAGFPPTSLSRE